MKLSLDGCVEWHFGRVENVVVGGDLTLANTLYCVVLKS